MLDVSSPIALDLRDVVLRRRETVILPSLSFTAQRGEHWALLGPNGAGKSTILSLAGGVVHPTGGTVDVLGHRLGRVELQALRRHIGHVNPRHPLRSPLSVVEVVLTGLTGSVESSMRWTATAAQRDHARELIGLFGLGHRADDLWPTLSQGERGRALIARALVGEPQLLLLDEPSTGLDVAAREQLLDTVDLLAATHPGLTSVLVTHHLEELPTSTSHALLLNKGRAVGVGPVDDVLTSENVTAAFEHPIEVRHDDGRWGARTGRRQEAPLGAA